MSMPTGIFFWISFSVQMISICPAKGNRCSEQFVNSQLVKVVIDQIQVLCVAQDLHVNRIDAVNVFKTACTIREVQYAYS